MKIYKLYIACAAVLGATAATAQQVDQGRFVIAGYGDAKYEQVDSADTSAFSGRFVPIFLFSLNEKMHVEAETEISIGADGETEIELEYADIHYFLTDTTTLTAGKFLLPFGQFGANWHPSWINRSPWTPGIYGSHGGTQAMTPLLPVLSDVGIGVQQIIPLNGGQKIFFDLYVTNGAAEEVMEEEMPAGVESEDEHELPEVAFEATNGDNNNNKAIGGRLAFAMLPELELGTSYYRASYSKDESLNIIAKGLDINFIGNNYTVRGEYIRTETDGLEMEDDVVERHRYIRDGWFIQGAFQAGRVWPALNGTELVLEWSETSKYAEATRWVAGINYWLDARTVVKLAYESTDLQEGEDDSRLALQLSYGF